MMYQIILWRLIWGIGCSTERISRIVFFCEIHQVLLQGNARKTTDVIGKYRTEQNYIGRSDNRAITYIPPQPRQVPGLMKNLIDYMNDPKDHLRPLVTAAIIHAQFETIHPFMDGNGRVGRMLVPMYLYAKKQIDLPCIFISEALEKDKMKYYRLLSDIREQGQWNQWIRFFLETVEQQCDKYINTITQINALYDKHCAVMSHVTRSANIIEIMNMLYRYPIITAKQIFERTKIPVTSINRYLALLVEQHIIFSDEKKKNRNYYYYDLLNILRQ